MRLLTYPARNIATQTTEEIYQSAASVLDQLLGLLAQPVIEPQKGGIGSPKSGNRRSLAFSGTLQEVNEHFYQKHWTDGLPIIPPTLEDVEAMLRYTDRPPDDVVGVLPPAMNAATVWNIAVNGVMAGCRPEYMPVLLAVVEAIAEPRFGLKHGGSTLGWTPLIILNGPISRQLGFESGLGVLRPHTRANIAVSRFLRLCMVNVAGFSVGTTDMPIFGSNYVGVLAEAEDKSPWQPLSVDRGFPAGTNLATVLSLASMSYHFISDGSAEQRLRELAREVARYLGGPPIICLVAFGPETTPVVCLTPLTASILAEAGLSKADIKQYFYEHSRVPAWHLEEQMQHLVPGFKIADAVREGKLAAAFGASEDPNRPVPVVQRPEDFQIVVAGYSGPTRSMIIVQQGFMGLDVSKEIRLPATWKQLVD